MHVIEVDGDLEQDFVWKAMGSPVPIHLAEFSATLRSKAPPFDVVMHIGNEKFEKTDPSLGRFRLKMDESEIRDALKSDSLSFQLFGEMPFSGKNWICKGEVKLKDGGE